MAITSLPPRVQTFKNHINGNWINATNGETFEQRNPARLSEVTGYFARSSPAQARQAVDAAETAYPAWRALGVHARAELLKRALRLMEQRQDEIARVLTLENGKTLRESRSEIVSAIKEMEFQIAEGQRTLGEVTPVSAPGTFAYATRQPLGPVGIIAPWNFPFNVPARKCTPALMAGNTCVFKPAMLTPRTGLLFTELFIEAGLPVGVLNFVTGGGSDVGNAIVEDPRIKAISFTGSTEVGRAIHQRAALNMTRTQLEMGGMNPTVVLADADLEAAADAVATAAFACSGQWCTSTSRVIVDRAIAQAFIKTLLQRVGAIRVGNGLDPETTMGPVCGEVQMNNILRNIEIGQKEGAQLLAGGSRLTREGLGEGCFIEPTVFGGVQPEMTIAQEEIFGPVLSILEARDFEHAVTIANGVRFGLSSSIFTRDLRSALSFIERSDVGLAHVNMISAYKEPQLAFGGIKESGHGLPEAGKSGFEFFTEHKVAYVKYA